jgi:ribosomal protein S18 acetylase RimI-like enzyme
MDEEIQISGFELADILECQLLASKAAQSSYAPFLSHVSHMFMPTSPLSDAEYRLVARSSNKIVGFVEIDGSHISNLFVDPLQQGKGIGTQLVRTVERIVRGDITLSCFTVNSNARRLYERLGFVVEREENISFGGSEILVWKMRKLRS